MLILRGVKTLAIRMEKAQENAMKLAKNGINKKVLRLSLGIEHIDDLIHDLEQAFDRKL